MGESKSAYWDRFYATGSSLARPVPSQFAAFVAGELHEPFRIVEFGSGAGRDALFFAAYGHQVTAVDGSPAAIGRGRAVAEAFGEKLGFIVSPIDAPGLAEQVPESGHRTLVYARSSCMRSPTPRSRRS